MCIVRTLEPVKNRETQEKKKGKKNADIAFSFKKQTNEATHIDRATKMHTVNTRRRFSEVYIYNSEKSQINFVVRRTTCNAATSNDKTKNKKPKEARNKQQCGLQTRKLRRKKREGGGGGGESRGVGAATHAHTKKAAGAFGNTVNQ